MDPDGLPGVPLPYLPELENPANIRHHRRSNRFPLPAPNGPVLFQLPRPPYRHIWFPSVLLYKEDHTVDSPLHIPSLKFPFQDAAWFH